jgi:hypothetical protein
MMSLAPPTQNACPKCVVQSDTKANERRGVRLPNFFPAVADLLNDIHQRRNEFSHGKPQAISEAIVIALVENLKDEHEAWITVFNSLVGP